MQTPPIYGNYARYYGMRSSAAAERARRARGTPAELEKVPQGGMDERVAALVAWLGGRAIDRVLDVGCNAAKPLIELCQQIRPREAVGVDIDPSLIAAASAALRTAWSQAAPNTTCDWRYFPSSFGALFGALPLPPEQSSFPNNIVLAAGDWVLANEEPQSRISALDAPGYDLVLTLSLTKWIHLQHGDSGLVRFLARIASVLRPGGFLVIEPQPWSSYEQARSISRELRASHAQLRIHPDDIEWWLSALGLEARGQVATGSGYGFARIPDSQLLLPLERNYADELWSKTQQEAILALGDAVVPSLSEEETARLVANIPATATDRQREFVTKYARAKFSDVPGIINSMAMHLKYALPTALAFRINMLLNVLSTRAGCLLLSGHIGPIQSLDPALVRNMLDRFANSHLKLLRQGGTGIRTLLIVVYYMNSEVASESMGYPLGPAADWQKPPRNDAQEAIQHDKFEFLNDKLTPSTTEIDTDILVIGSGAGAGVVAKYLSERGGQVLVVDRGIYVNQSQMKGNERFAYEQMYDSGGFIPTEDSSMFVLAGSGFGGGTTINWSATLQPRHFLREAWSRKYGLPYFQSSLFTQDLEEVERYVGASTDFVHNRANTLLALGAARAGQPYNAVPQNSGGNPHYCGKCHMGCASGNKCSGPAAWFRDAAKHGARFMTRTHVHRILFEGKTAVGAIAEVDGRRIVLRARRAVVCSAGSLHTPAILLRSPELRSNTQIGKHLRLHPVAFVHSYYTEPVRAWEGGILTTVSNAAEMVDPRGWGAKIETMASSPALHAALAPYHGGYEHKQRLMRYAHCVSMIVVVRDRDEGAIVLDSDGRPLLQYTPSKFDFNSMLEGILRATEIAMAAGAVEIVTSQAGVEPFITPLDRTPVPNERAPLHGAADMEYPAQGNLAHPAFREWQDKIRKVGCEPLRIQIGSAHQLGSCRLGADPRQSALDPKGHVRGAENLWVADGSVLPEASGVNPMLTIQGTCRGIARNIATEIGIEAPPAHI
ncbi:hypothetical protein MCUN1_003097 [Malassezia cuniculi]|uniref:Bin3-type SAM domain-containing protein n=1 Tax=Malassezia cuniculi TaxID=948313 RepID=A0AAF0EW22_9BASI|nr:hypothetical protein MCUN1_003097 [Malassezia cuniculi]